MDGCQSNCWEVFLQGNWELSFLFEQSISIPLYFAKNSLLRFYHMLSFEKVFCLGKRKVGKLQKVSISVEVGGLVCESFQVEFAQ